MKFTYLDHWTTHVWVFCSWKRSRCFALMLLFFFFFKVRPPAFITLISLTHGWWWWWWGAGRHWAKRKEQLAAIPAIPVRRYRAAGFEAPPFILHSQQPLIDPQRKEDTERARVCFCVCLWCAQHPRCAPSLHFEEYGWLIMVPILSSCALGWTYVWSGSCTFFSQPAGALTQGSEPASALCDKFVPQTKSLILVNFGREWRISVAVPSHSAFMNQLGKDLTSLTKCNWPSNCWRPKKCDHRPREERPWRSKTWGVTEEWHHNQTFLHFFSLVWTLRPGV